MLLAPKSTFFACRHNIENVPDEMSIRVVQFLVVESFPSRCAI